MPFITSPNLWSKLNFFKEINKTHERAHKDGIRIVTINKQHDEYDELMGKLTPLVRAWEDENSTDEEE